MDHIDSWLEAESTEGDLPEIIPNRALDDPPMHVSGGPPALLALAVEAHHDDAWRKDFAAWRWSLPDIGDAVYVRLVESEWPHDTRTATEMIVPREFLAEIMAGFRRVERAGL